jgi:hypothetical protein
MSIQRSVICNRATMISYETKSQPYAASHFFYFGVTEQNSMLSDLSTPESASLIEYSNLFMKSRKGHYGDDRRVPDVSLCQQPI